MAAQGRLTLNTMLGNYPNTKALKSGEIRSDLIDFDFVEVKVANNLFKKVVREAAYDFAELAIVTYLQARTYGKPYVLLPAVVVGRGQHHTIAYNAERGVLDPSELAGKRVGVRAYTVTTGTWVRGILAQDYGVDLDKVSVRVRDGHTGARRRGDIGFASLRGGDNVGEHSVIFAADGETVVLTHKATDRSVFARGAVKAALWGRGKGPGLFSMMDVLGIKAP